MIGSREGPAFWRRPRSQRGSVLLPVATAVVLGGCTAGASSDLVHPVRVADPVWEELYRDDLFFVSLDVAHVDPGPEPDTFAVWYRTDRLETQFEDEQPWNREIIRSLLRCDPVQFKTVRITVFLDDGPPVAQEGGSMAEAARVEWRDPVLESIDEASMEGACAKVAGRRRAAGFVEGARRGVDPGARTIGGAG